MDIDFNTVEGYTLEFKEDISPDSTTYLKTIGAFANGAGGKVLFGVADDGTILGLDRKTVASKKEQIINAIVGNCCPRIQFTVQEEVRERKVILCVRVFPFENQPNIISVKGKYYERIGNETREVASDSDFVDELRLKARGKSFDRLQTDGVVTLDEAKELCKDLYNHAIEKPPRELTVENLVSRGILREVLGELYPTNAWYLLTNPGRKFDNYATVKMAVFKGTNRAVLIDRKMAEGPLYIQLEEAIKFLERSLRFSSRIIGIHRLDQYELPMEGVREIIANALCHRSYLQRASMYSDRFEVVSPGKLDPHLISSSLETNALSYPRNPSIFEIFHYLHYIEGWGTGIQRVYALAEEFGLKPPEIKELGDNFSITLYRKDLEFDSFGVILPLALHSEMADSGREMADSQQGTTIWQIVERYVKAHDINKAELLKLKKVIEYGMDIVTAQRVSVCLNRSDSTAKRLIRRLKDMGLLEKANGKGKGAYKWKKLT